MAPPGNPLGKPARDDAHHDPCGIIGAFLGGFIFSSLLGFRYEGFNVPSIVVATVGAVVLLAISGGIRIRRTWP